jgi:hypothetical protein
LYNNQDIAWNIFVRFTIIAESDDFHTICQIESPSLSSVILDWAQVASLCELGLSNNDRHLFFEDFCLDDYAVALDGLKNAWCHSFLIRDKSLIFTIFLSKEAITEVTRNFSYSDLFSFCALADGGTYVAQYVEKTSETAQKLWFNKDQHWSQDFGIDFKSVLREGFNANQIVFKPVLGLVGVSRLQLNCKDHKLSVFCLMTQANAV